jgi:pyruvate/2-oxoglutarate/acetoin dehydrogenase E1 component
VQACISREREGDDLDVVAFGNHVQLVCDNASRALS